MRCGRLHCSDTFDFLAFISHCEAESGKSPHLLTKTIESESPPHVHSCPSKVFVHTTKGGPASTLDLDGLVGAIQNSCTFLILQTEGVLASPRCLLELYVAALYGVPIIPIQIRRKGYRPDQQQQFLENLPAKLRETNLKSADQLEDLLSRLEGGDHTIEAVGEVLSKVLPHRMSMDLDESGGKRLQKAQLLDILDRIQVQSYTSGCWSGYSALKNCCVHAMALLSLYCSSRSAHMQLCVSQLIFVPFIFFFATATRI